MTHSLPALLLVGFTATAHADAIQPERDVMGRFPILEAGLVAGFSMTPIPYTMLDAHDNLSGLAGPDLHAHVDARTFLLNLQGFYNVANTDTAWKARAQLVVGARTKHRVLKSMHDSTPTSSGSFTRTTEHYLHKHVPMIIGVSAGASVVRVNETSYTSAFGDSNLRPAATLPMIDAGFTLQSPQIKLTVGPLVSITDKIYGAHWEFGMSFPVGSMSLFWRLSGDHLVGDDPLDNSGRRFGALVLATFGLAPGYGVGL